MFRFLIVIQEIQTLQVIQFVKWEKHWMVSAQILSVCLKQII